MWCSLIKERLADFRIDLLSFWNSLEGQKSSVYSVSSSEFFLSLYEVKVFKTLLTTVSPYCFGKSGIHSPSPDQHLKSIVQSIVGKKISKDVKDRMILHNKKRNNNIISYNLISIFNIINSIYWLVTVSRNCAKYFT